MYSTIPKRRATMPKCRGMTLNHQTFRTQREAQDFVRTLLHSISETNSVKQGHKDDYTTLCALVERHPESSTKLRNMCDLGIRRNRMNPRCMEMYVVYKDGAIEDISWVKCISGKPTSVDHDFRAALRCSVEGQIHTWRKVSKSQYCDLCQTWLQGTPWHVDHVIHFQKLAADFVAEYGICVPNKYDDHSDGSNRAVFRQCDEHIAAKFGEYHQAHAKLRALCSHCNLTRPKWGSDHQIDGLLE